MVKFSATVLSFAVLGTLTRADSAVCSDSLAKTIADCTNAAGKKLDPEFDKQMAAAGKLDKTICPLIKTATDCYTDKCACTTEAVNKIAAVKAVATVCAADDFGMCATVAEDKPAEGGVGTCTLQQTATWTACAVPGANKLKEFAAKVEAGGMSESEAKAKVCSVYKALWSCYTNTCICTDEQIDAVVNAKKKIDDEGVTCPADTWGVCLTATKGANDTPKSGATETNKAAADAAAAAAKKVADEAKANEAKDKAIKAFKEANPNATAAEIAAAGKKAYDASIKESNTPSTSAPASADDAKKENSGSILQLPATLVAVAVLVASTFV